MTSNGTHHTETEEVDEVAASGAKEVESVLDEVALGVDVEDNATETDIALDPSEAITDTMKQEEKAIEEEHQKQYEEERRREANKEFDEYIADQRRKRLNTLITRAGFYSNWLGSRLESRQKEQAQQGRPEGATPSEDNPEENEEEEPDQDYYYLERLYRFDFEDLNEGNDKKILDKEAKESVVTNLHQILKPFLLRRVKTEVEIELPKKKEFLLFAPLVPRQKELYDACVRGLGQLRELLMKDIKDKQGTIASPAAALTEPAEASKEEEPSPKGQRISSRSKNKNVSYDETISDDEFFDKMEQQDSIKDDPAAEEKKALERQAYPSANLMPQQRTPKKGRRGKARGENEVVVRLPEIVACSGKMLMLERLLPRLFADGHKVLIFSQMTRMLDILEDWFEHIKGWKYCRIDGSVSLDVRKQQIADFNERPDVNVFLLSTRAGGLGINLTAADTVIIYDSDWNPQVDLQAQDRVHRIGQTKPVIIYRLVTSGTVEKKILDRANNKRKLEKLVIHKAEFKGKSEYYKSNKRVSSLHELAAILEADDAEEVTLSSVDPESMDGDMILLDRVISEEELARIMDRSPESFEKKEKDNTAEREEVAQQIASVGHILPKEWKEFRKLYDSAPAVSYEEVVKIIKEELGSSPEDLFSEFGKEPVASASIAQVHRARLKTTNQEVAVKVQKPEIPKQIDLDLFAFRAVTYLLEKIFDLPLYWSADYIENHIRQEVDFVLEAKNAETAAKSIKEVPSLSGRVHIPSIVWPLTSQRVMTAEWIEGTRFSDVDGLTREKFDRADLMTVIVNLFCDVDHGLYVKCSETFKHNYAVLWKSLFTGELPVLEEITRQWGIQDVKGFASATLQRPWMPGTALHIGEMGSIKDAYEMHLDAKERAKQGKFLGNTDRLPKELIFIGRNLNIVRSNNKELGSPVNRINLIARYAVNTLSGDWTIWTPTHSTEVQKVRHLASHPFFSTIGSYVMLLRFESALLMSSLAFYTTRLFQKVRWLLIGGTAPGFEELMDEAARNAIYLQYGILIDKEAFDG
ncbi:hypothetical protein HDU96_004646 [Phlyctochytrium bullatum]|nr:hypothetical protein HDU96_004646 [Phlyctochytrium bullatum]